MPLTLSQSEPKARKSHQCSYCYRVIDKGETYERSTNIYDGRLYTWKSCNHCLAFIYQCGTEPWDAWEGMSADELQDWDGYVGPFEMRCVIMYRQGWRRKTDGSLYDIPKRRVAA